jgi:hypothetical protein
MLAVADAIGMNAADVGAEVLNLAAPEERAFDAAAVDLAFSAPLPLPTERGRPLAPPRIFVGVDPAEGGARSRYVAQAVAPSPTALIVVASFEVDFDSAAPQSCAASLADWLVALEDRYPRAHITLAVEGNLRASAGLAIELVRGLVARRDDSRIGLVDPDGPRPGCLNSTRGSKAWATAVMQLWINFAERLHPGHAPCVRVAEDCFYRVYAPSATDLQPVQLCRRLAREFAAFDPLAKSAVGDDNVMAFALALMAINWLVTAERAARLGQPLRISYAAADLDVSQFAWD